MVCETVLGNLLPNSGGFFPFSYSGSFDLFPEMYAIMKLADLMRIREIERIFIFAKFLNF